MTGDPPHDGPRSRHFNPDHFLETEAGRVFTAERSAAAWESAYSALAVALQSSRPAACLYVVVGVQGAGKSSWIDANAEALGSDAHFFDAALPRARHRERVLTISRSFGVPAVAVWIHVPLSVALARNQARRVDHRVPEDAVRSVFAMMEPPTIEEGFVKIENVPG
jgi:hypothetical protein